LSTFSGFLKYAQPTERDNPLFNLKTPETLRRNNKGIFSLQANRMLVLERSNLKPIEKPTTFMLTEPSSPHHFPQLNDNKSPILPKKFLNFDLKRPSYPDTCSEAQTAAHRTILDESSCPILRDSGDNYKPLERLFGKLRPGMAFGETFLLFPFE